MALELARELARVGIPQVHPPVLSSRGQPPAVRRELEGALLEGAGGLQEQGLPRGHIEQARQGARVATHGGQVPAIGRPLQPFKYTGVFARTRLASVVTPKGGWSRHSCRRRATAHPGEKSSGNAAPWCPRKTGCGPWSGPTAARCGRHCWWPPGVRPERSGSRLMRPSWLPSSSLRPVLSFHSRSCPSAAPGGQLLSVRREGQIRDGSQLLAEDPALAGPRIPDAHGLVQAPRRGQVTPGRDRNRRHDPSCSSVSEVPCSRSQSCARGALAGLDERVPPIR